MSRAAISAGLDPLASRPLRHRFPQLDTVLDGGAMRAQLQRLLLDGSGLVAEACMRPRVEVDGGVCRLQYPLRVRTPSGASRDLLVLAAVFADPDEAGRYARSALRPVARRWAPHELPSPRPCGVHGLLGLACSPFPVTGPLPTLVELTSPPRAAEVLRERLALAGGGARLAGIDLVRLRRAGGCVLRYRLDVDGGLTTVYGKVGYAGAGELVDGVLVQLEDRARRLPQRPILYPHVLGRAADLDLVLIAEVPGLRPDLGAGAGAVEAAVESAATVAATIHTSGVKAGAPFTWDDELERARRAVGPLHGDDPSLAAWLSAVLDSVAARAARTPLLAHALSHGDLTPSQLLLDGSRIGVVDFDGVCQAEPAFDLGRFLAYLRVALAKSGTEEVSAHEARLLGVHAEVGGRPVPADRAAAYEITSLVLMVAHAWRQLKPSRLRLACAVLERRVAELGLGLRASA